MKFKELVSFSIYEYDLKKFGGDWNNVRRFLAEEGLDGLELLVNFEPVPPEIPSDIVTAVHLPSFMGWYRVWTDDCFRIPPEIPEESVKYFYGGRSREEIVSNFRDCLVHASVLEPAYGVYHATYNEVTNAFAIEQPYSDREILTATADFLNETAAGFPGEEPPFKIYIENLWYPGLTFLDNETALEFINMLEFENWRLLLDTGHLMNITRSCNDEEGAIDTVMECLERLDERILEKIDGVHLHLSTSGDYQLNAREPEGYKDLPLDDKFSLLYDYLRNTDQHRPFSSWRCREIIEFISPSYVTHELPGETSGEIKSRLRMQTGALRHLP